MSEISERYARLSDAFAATVAAVPDDRWDAPTPCADWDALALVRHVIESQVMFLGMVDREPQPHPPIAEDPAGAFDVARRQILADLEDEEAATETYEGQFGTKSFEWGVDTFLSFDLVVHRWDLARATGLDDTIDPDDLEWVMAHAASWGDAARTNGVFGPALEPPEGADRQTEVLAFLGRSTG